MPRRSTPRSTRASAGCTVITVSSHANAAAAKAHALVRQEAVGRSPTSRSTTASHPRTRRWTSGAPRRSPPARRMAVVFVAMALVAESGARLAARGYPLDDLRLAQRAGRPPRPQPGGVRGLRAAARPSAAPRERRVLTGRRRPARAALRRHVPVRDRDGAASARSCRRSRRRLGIDLAQAGALFLVMNGCILADQPRARAARSTASG